MKFGFNSKYTSMLWNHKTAEIMLDDLDMIVEFLAEWMNSHYNGPGPVGQAPTTPPICGVRMGQFKVKPV